MSNLIDDLFHRVALAVTAGESTVSEASKEALRFIEDLAAGKPHGYDLTKVTNAVQTKVNAQINAINAQQRKY